jgi:hypothetical protein
MALPERRELYAEIETRRGRPLLAYVTSKREGVNAAMATDALPFLIDQLQRIAPGEKQLDFLIASYGGDPMVAWRIMSLLRERFDRVSVLVPQSAYSAATLLALGADEIVMHPHGHLGPVDMQITTFNEGHRRHFSTEDIDAFLAFVREELGITDQEHLRRLFELMCQEVGTVGVGFTARSSKLALALAERLLGLHMKDDATGAKRKALVENLSRAFHSHAYPVSRTEAIQMGLPVNGERDATLEGMMWNLWLDLEQEFKERQPFSPIIELLNSPQADRLLAPVPLLHLPVNASSPTYFSADMDAVKGAITEKVEPIDFETVDAVIESSRLAFRGMTKGKILACRTPDLQLQYNLVVSYRGWGQSSL